MAAMGAKFAGWGIIRETAPIAMKIAGWVNLEISDLDLFKSTDYYYLLFSSNNVLYETGSLDFHTFNQPQSILTLKDNNFNLGNVGITTEVSDGVYLNKNL